MDTRNYWLDLFTGTTWIEFLKAGGEVSGFRSSRWNICQKIKVGDYLLCYITGISRFIGVLEVISPPFKDNMKIWKDEDFPVRFRVKRIVELDFDTGIPVQELRDELSFFRNLSSPHAWTGRFRGSPTKWSKEDGEAVVNALFIAKENPIERLFDKRKLQYRPKAIRARIGSVTVPEYETRLLDFDIDKKGLATHTEIQALLLKLGSDMGFYIWVARNDRGKSYKGKPFNNFPRIKDSLPLQFDDATNKTIELIDVLWLQGNAIVAAFEIESTTSIYSGLLRMSDLIAMQPNLNIPLYLVAPEERREKVLTEVNRPTFSNLSPPLSEICRYISFSSFRDYMKQVKPFIRFLKPDFLEEISESCELEEI